MTARDLSQQTKTQKGQATSAASIGLSTGWRNYALLLMLGCVLAMNFVMTKVAVTALPAGMVVTVRLVLATLILLAIMFAAGKRFPPLGKIWLPLAGAALFGHTLPFGLLAWAQQGIDAGLAAILMATMPLFTLLLAQIFTNDEKPNRYAIAGFALALAGIVVLFGPERLASLADQSLRQYAAVAAAICYGTNAIITKSLTGIAWQSSTAAFMLLASIMALPLLLFDDFSAVPTDIMSWLPVIYSGVMATAFAAVMIIIIVKRTSASFISQINFIIPVFGVGFSILIVNEVLPPNGLFALIIILAGVALARRRPRRTLISINKGA